MQVTLLAPVTIDPESLVDVCSQESLFNLVVEVDARTQDWSFTERLYQHFAKLHAQYLKECEQ